MKYLVVDVNTGKWEWDKNLDHPSLAVPKMLTQLKLRIEKLLRDVSESVKIGMLESNNSRNIETKEIIDKIDDAKEELYLHFYMLSDFKRKVEKNIETEKSPILALKNMKTDGSPLIRRRTPSLSHMYDRYDDDEIQINLKSSEEDINRSIEILDKTKECWKEMLSLNNEYDFENLLLRMTSLREKLDVIQNTDIYDSFFTFDDATRGILRTHLNINFQLGELLVRLDDYIQRMMLRGMDNYFKSEERENVEKAIEKLREYNMMDDQHLSALLSVKSLLETRPSDKASIKTCYKKIGELHSNIHQKMFELESLNYLEKYFLDNTNEFSEKTKIKLEKIHEKFVDRNEIIRFDKQLKNMHELEIYRKVLEDLILDCEPGKIYFYLNNKLHNINAFLLAKYFELDEKKMYELLELIGSEPFRHFIETCNELMLCLRKELKREIEVNSKDLLKIGLTTSKTNMINSFSKAVEEILASLGTFMGNTLHNLIREILQNLPYSESKYRKMIYKTYKKTEETLNIFDNFNSSLEISEDN